MKVPKDICLIVVSVQISLSTSFIVLKVNASNLGGGGVGGESNNICSIGVRCLNSSLKSNIDCMNIEKQNINFLFRYQGGFILAIASCQLVSFP